MINLNIVTLQNIPDFLLAVNFKILRILCTFSHLGGGKEGKGEGEREWGRGGLRRR